MYKTTEEILSSMLETHYQLTGVRINTTDLNREEVIKAMPFAAALSAQTSMLVKVKNARHPDTSTEIDLEEHLKARQLQSRIQPHESQGNILFYGDDGAEVPVGTRVRRVKDGKEFITVELGIISAGQAICLCESVETGQAQNIETLGEDFGLVDSVDGVDASAINSSVFANGRNLESASEMLSRIKRHDRKLDTGGNIAAYEDFAKNASPAVVSAIGIKHPNGQVGYVDVVITSGTTDIEKAVRANESVVRIPSTELLNQVQQYVDIKKPTTDIFNAIAPNEVDFSIDVDVSMIDDINYLVVKKEIETLCKIYIYQAKSKDRLSVTDLERQIDSSVGKYISYRRVDFVSHGNFYDVGETSILTPNTITVSKI